MKEEMKLLFKSMIIPAIFIILLWIIKIAEVSLDFNFSKLGVYPRNYESLLGIFTMPLVHGDFQHLIGNSIPLFILLTFLFSSYRIVSYRVFALIYLFTGMAIWVGARSAYHIGASGLVYGLAGFLFTSGLIRKNSQLSGISLIVVFLYGGMVWGVFPHSWEPVISWESHLYGLIIGVLLAIYYRRKGPKDETYSWDYETEDDQPDMEEIDKQLDEYLDNLKDKNE